MQKRLRSKIRDDLAELDRHQDKDAEVVVSKEYKLLHYSVKPVSLLRGC